MKRILLLSFAFLTVIAFSAMAQRTVSGKVTDDAGEPLPGVNVVIKGTTTGTTTDLDGNYRLSVDEGATLVFSFVGFETQEIQVGARTTIDISMGGATELQEVVVTALGVSKESKSVGYAVQNVEAENLTKARETNLVNALSGRIAGVQVTNSGGQVGSSSRIVLRGAASISGAQNPLFVIDGIPIDNSSYGNAGSGGGFDQPNGAADINPDDIESISVLKGANAAALYGARAANGVILITTKSGKGTKGIGVSVNSSTTFEKPLKLPDFQNSYGQSGDRDVFEFVDGQNGRGDGVDESWGPPLDVGLMFPQFTSNGQFAEPWVSHPDNVKDFYETGVTRSNNVSVTGGSEVGNFRLSLTNMNQKGIVPNTDYERNTIAVSGNYNLTDRFKAGFSANYINSQSDNLPIVGYNNENPVQQMIWSGRQVDFNALRDYNNLPLAGPNTVAAGTPLNWNTLFQNNPFWVLHTNLNKLEKDRLIGNFNLSYEVTDWFTVQVKSGTDTWSQVTKENKAKGSNSDLEGYYREIYRKWYETNHSFLLMFTKTFGDIDASLNLGGNAMHQNYNRIVGEASQLELDGVYNLSNVKSGVTPSLTNRLQEKKINSFYGAGSVSYKNYIFLEFTGRNDWYSVLPTSSNSKFFPSASLSAVVTDMLPMNSDVLSYLKIRGGWAQVGSDGNGVLEPYSLQPTFRFRGNPWGSVLLPYLPNTLNNPSLKPEVTTSIEFGLETKLFNGAVSLAVTYYDSKSEDLLVPIEVSASSGYNFVFDNVGEMQNKGIEVQLEARVLNRGDFSWDINANFSKFNNEVKSLGGLETLTLGGQWSLELQAREGQPYGSLYGAAYERSPNGEVIHQNGVPKIDPEFKVLGNIQPDWTGGISNTFSYKGVSLSTLVDAKIGGDLHSMTYTWGRYAGVLEETLTGREGGIVGHGVVDNGDGTYSPNTQVVSAKRYNQAAFSNSVHESAIFDASYVKLRQVQLGYTLPNSLFGDLPFRDVSVSVVGRNLAILYSKVPHIDPETGFSSAESEQGQEFGQIPSTRSLGFNINFKM